jgi:O-methyltransferase
MEISPQQIFDSLHKVRDVRIKGSAKVSHAVVIPLATYAPWFDDRDFLSVFQVIQGNTLVDWYRCYELWSLVGQIVRLGGDILEVGVWRGGTGCLIASRAQQLAAPARVFLCDTFQGVVKSGEMDSTYRGGEHADASIAAVEQLAARLALNNIQILQGIFPDETGPRISDRLFSLVHIDVDVYDSARDVLNWAWPRLCVGGVIVYDDYGFESCDGITRLVNERSPMAGAVTLHNLNGHAVTIKVAP